LVTKKYYLRGIKKVFLYDLSMNIKERKGLRRSAVRPGSLKHGQPEQFKKHSDRPGRILTPGTVSSRGISVIGLNANRNPLSQASDMSLIDQNMLSGVIDS